VHPAACTRSSVGTISADARSACSRSSGRPLGRSYSDNSPSSAGSGISAATEGRRTKTFRTSEGLKRICVLTPCNSAFGRRRRASVGRPRVRFGGALGEGRRGVLRSGRSASSCSDSRSARGVPRCGGPSRAIRGRRPRGARSSSTVRPLAVCRSRVRRPRDPRRAAGLRAPSRPRSESAASSGPERSDPRSRSPPSLPDF
jgi:hypothetical protein